MKLFIKLMCLLLVLALIGPFILKGPDGRSLLSLRQILPKFVFKVPDLPSWESTPEVLDKHGKGTKAYRWKADDGSLQFSNIEPENTEYEVIWLNPDRNLIQGLSVDEEPLAQTFRKNSQESTDNPGSILSISPEQFRKLQGDVKNVQKLQDERYKILESL